MDWFILGWPLPPDKWYIQTDEPTKLNPHLFGGKKVKVKAVRVLKRFLFLSKSHHWRLNGDGCWLRRSKTEWNYVDKIKKYIYTESVLKCFLFISLFAHFNCDTSSEVDSIPNSHGHRLAHNMSSHDLISVAGIGCISKCCAGWVEFPAIIFAIRARH